MDRSNTTGRMGRPPRDASRLPFSESARRVEPEHGPSGWRVRCNKCGIRDCATCSTAWFSLGEDLPRPWSAELYAVASMLEDVFEVRAKEIVARISLAAAA